MMPAARVSTCFRHATFIGIVSFASGCRARVAFVASWFVSCRFATFIFHCVFLYVAIGDTLLINLFACVV